MAEGYKAFSQAEYKSFSYPDGSVAIKGWLKDEKPDDFLKTFDGIQRKVSFQGEKHEVLLLIFNEKGKAISSKNNKNRSVTEQGKIEIDGNRQDDWKLFYPDSILKTEGFNINDSSFGSYFSFKYEA
jgi:hypothetical protein